MDELGNSVIIDNVAGKPHVPLGPCITETHRPPGRNSNCSNVFVKPAGTHHRARRSGCANAAKTVRVGGQHPLRAEGGVRISRVRHGRFSSFQIRGMMQKKQSTGAVLCFLIPPA
jgi:hypothetical protein